MVINLQYFGGRGGGSGRGRGGGGGGAGGGTGGGTGGGSVAIQKRIEPDEHNRATVEKYYMTGTRNAITHWDDDGNYYPKGRTVTERVNERFSTREEAIKYAKKNKYKYLNI